MTDQRKKAHREAIKEINQNISETNKKNIKLKFHPWIPKGSGFRTPIRFYVDSADDEYILKYKNKLIIHCNDKSRQLVIENFLMENDIDIKSMKNLSELNDYLSTKHLLVKKSTKTNKTTAKRTNKKESKAHLSKLKKGDKLNVQHGEKQLTITITHIELEKGIPSVNVSCSGDEEIQVSTDIKGKAHSKRSDKIKGSNKGRGWSQNSGSIKK